MSDWAFVREQIKERLSLSSIVGRKVRFDARKSQPARGDYWACCPFHSEKTPSFHVVDSQGFYKCFGCGASGDHFKFLMETENCSIAEATERLAADAGVELPKRSAKEIETQQKRVSLYDVLAQAAVFFQDQLKTGEGARARDYLHRRGLSPEVWQAFGLGYAPSNGQALIAHLNSLGVQNDTIRETGLLSSRDQPASLLRGRVVFPIADSRSRTIAFGGRGLDENSQPKYLNTSESALFHKSRALYNVAAARGRLNRSALEIRPGAERVLVVEGYMDVIALSGAGFTRSVAPLGTALTEDHLKILWQMADTPIICLDGDAAGERAAARAVERALPLLKPGKTLAIAHLPAGQDPDDLLAAAGPGAFEEIISQAKPLADALWDQTASGLDLRQPDERAKVEAALTQRCREIGDDVVRRHYESFVREKLWQVRSTNLSRRRQSSPGWPAKPAPVKRAKGRPNTAAERVFLALMIANPMAVESDMEALATIPIVDPALDKLRNEIIHLAASGDDLQRQEMIDRLNAQGNGALVNALLSNNGFTCMAESRPGAPVEDVRNALAAIMKLFSARSDATAARAAVSAGLSGDSWAASRRLKEASQMARLEAVDASEPEPSKTDPMNRDRE